MARILRTLALTIALTLAAGCTRHQESPPPSRSTPAALFDRWLASTSSDVVDKEIVTEILNNRDAMERQFIEAFRNGPSAARRDAVEESVQRVWSLVQVQLAEPDVYGLDEQEIAEMKSLSLATQKRNALHRFEHSFKAAALRGLGITQGAEAKATLTQIAGDRSSPFRAIAADVLLSKKGS
jgi:hypothetical protein